MSMHKTCCCEAGGPAVFISIVDEDSSAIYEDLTGAGECNPFCLMDEDVIHPVVNPDKYQINNDFIYEEETGEVDEDGEPIMERKVRVGLEVLLHPLNNCNGTDLRGASSIPQCYDLPFEYAKYNRPGEEGRCQAVDWQEIVTQLANLIENRFGPMVLGETEDGEPEINPYPTQIYFNIDTSGSHRWEEGEPIIQGLIEEFSSRYGAEVAETKFNPCLDGPDEGKYCAGWGCCEQEECPESYCYTETGIRRFSFEMRQENYLSSMIDLMALHFAGQHCDRDKLDACGISSNSGCYNCRQCGSAIVCGRCLGVV